MEGAAPLTAAAMERVEAGEGRLVVGESRRTPGTGSTSAIAAQQEGGSFAVARSCSGLEPPWIKIRSVMDLSSNTLDTQMRTA